ncbi:hypothetical protein Btru_059242 [Bulinus truncatus]|nr:hypothetical protein Btru_059242 [Bulinus truncatus]
MKFPAFWEISDCAETVSGANHESESGVNHLEEGNSHIHSNSSVSQSISTQDCQNSMCQKRSDAINEVQSSLKYLEHQFENQFDGVYKKFEEYKTRFENENKQSESYKKDLSDLNSIQEKVDSLHYFDIKDTVEQRIQFFMTDVRAQIDKLSHTVKDVQGDCSRCDDKLEKIDKSCDTFSSLISKFSETDDKLQAASDKLEHVMSNVKSLETRFNENFNDFQREFKNGNEQMRMSLLLLFKRLLLLETSRDILSKKVFSSNKESHGQIEEMKQSINSLRKQCKELMSTSDSLGFTAYIPPGGRTVKLTSNSDRSLKCFMHVLCTKGRHYDPATGKFTAPCHGLYVVSLCISVVSAANVRLMAVRELCGEKRCIASTGSRVHGTSSCSVALTELKAGEEVYVMSSCDSGDVVLGDLSYFTCFLIKKLLLSDETNAVMNTVIDL